LPSARTEFAAVVVAARVPVPARCGETDAIFQAFDNVNPLAQVEWVLVFEDEVNDGCREIEAEINNMLTIKNADYEQLRRHGEETYPFECCGVLLGQFTGQDRVVQEVVGCGNTRADRPQDRYHIDPKELISVQRQATGKGLEIVGFYHSHPDHPARWSQTDLAEAHWLGCSYVITSVDSGVARDTNAFVLLGDTEENKRLENEEIHVASPVEDRTICR